MKSMKSLLSIAVGICFIFTAGCGQNSLISDNNGTTKIIDNQGIVTTQEGSITVESSSRGRDTLPFASLSDINELEKGNTEFAFDMYKKLSKPDSNLFFSPYSISIALAMTWAGARGQTESEMATTLHFDLDQAHLHPAFDALDLGLSARCQNDGFELHVMNQLWGEKTYQFLPDYINTASASYGASLRLLDFINNPDPSRLIINSWVSDQTNSRVQDLLAPGTISDSTRLVLTNAIYFNAQWADTFHKESTYDQMFCTGSDSVPVKFMHKEAGYRYVANSDLSALEVPYKGNNLSMLFILPQQGKTASVESSLSSDMISSLAELMLQTQVIVAIPKFKFTTSSTSLKDILGSLGMVSAFSDAADFSGIDGTRLLRISDVIHKAFVAVDERGTEAAAATAVIMVAGSAFNPNPVYFTLDRAFIFLIRDTTTGTVLFMGKVAKPVIED
jgi:serpin B